jgi:large conductance mechanosensitive channel
MLSEFKAFLTKSNALALALGVIIGGATGKVVSAIVDDLIMPVISFVMPAGAWQDAQIILSQSTDAAGKLTVNAVKYGHFLSAVVDFVLISFVVFFITKQFLKAPVLPDPTKVCPECLESVPIAAKKCRACTSSLA